jgi:mRNA interferase MazF
VKLGDVVWIDPPAGQGHVQSGRRPAIVLQCEAVSRAVPTVVAVPLTSSVDAARFPATVAIEPDAANGLRVSSVALVFQIATVDRRRVLRTVGHLSEVDLDAVLRALAVLTAR